MAEEEFKTANSAIVEYKLIIPLTDAHMHIQSNDIAPVPLMKGLANYTGLPKKWNKVNFIELTFLDKNYDKETIELINKLGTGIFNINQGMAETITNFFRVTASERERLTGATALFTQYGEITKYNSYLIACIYKDEEKVNANRRIVSIVSEKDEGKLRKTAQKDIKEIVDARILKKKMFERITAHYYIGDKSRAADNNSIPRIAANVSFSVIHTMDLMYAHYWGAYGIPIYISYDKKLYYILNEWKLPVPKKDGNNIDTMVCYNIYDIPESALGKYFNIGNKEAASKSNTGITNEKYDDGVPYIHILAEVEEQREIVQYESFDKHIKYTKIAALRYPLRYLPFYHFDPRRFYAPLEPLGKNHRFYILSGGNTLEAVAPGAITASLTSGVLHQKKEFSDCEKELLVNGGMFWGIKMYAALGYPPYLYDDTKAQKIFPRLESGAYEKLLDFYRFCAKNDIPITCHASPQGMTIADPGVYLKEFLKQRECGYKKSGRANFPVNKDAYFAGLGLIDGFSSPESWEAVLKTEGLADLTLCLAHFGGSRFFDGTFENGSPYDWKEGIRDLICKYNNVYTDISNFTFKSFKELPEEIDESVYKKYCPEELYMRNRGAYMINYGAVNSLYQKGGNSRDILKFAQFRLEMERRKKTKLYQTAKTLADLIRKDEKKLKERIVFGTDWPMGEAALFSDSGKAPVYNGAMFVMLQLLTDMLGNKWDAWHQFAVINPLRFLGVLGSEVAVNGKQRYTIKMDKFDQMKTALLSFAGELEKKEEENTENKKNKKKSFKDIFGFSFKDIHNEEHLEFYEKIKGISIPKSEDMRTGDGKLLLTGR